MNGVKFPLQYKSAKLESGVVKVVETMINEMDTDENTVILKVKYMGICRADVKEVTGSRDIPQDRGPLFGHEFIGEVVFAGNQTGIKLGSLVTFNPNVTPNRTTGYAEYFKIKADADTLHSALINIPQETVLNEPWQPEPLACIVHTLRKLEKLTRKGFLAGKSMAIIGAGNSGMLFGMYAKKMGVSDIKLFNRTQGRISFALERGLFAKNEVELLNEAGKYKDTYDVVVVVPTRIGKETLEVAHILAKENGVVLLYGGTRDGDTYLDSGLNIDNIRRKELIEPVSVSGKSVLVSGAYGCDRSDFEEAIRLFNYEHQEFPLERMKSKETTLANLPEIMHGLAKNEVDYPGKVIVVP